MKKTALEATAYHEAGHMVAAWRQKLKIRRATIVPAKGFSGEIAHESPLKGINLEIEASDRADMRTDKAVMICLAGPAAQRKYRPSSWRHYHGGADYALVSDLALRRNGSGEIATAYTRWMELSAKAMIEANWHFVDLFAKHLIEHKTLFYEEIKEIVLNAVNARYAENPPHIHILTGAEAEQAKRDRAASGAVQV